MAQGTVVITAKVQDTATARRELESLGRASTQAGSQTAKANQEIAVSSRMAAAETQQLQRQQAEFHTQLAKTAGSVAMAVGQISMLSVAVMEVRGHSGAATATLAALTGRIVPLGIAVTAAVVAIRGLAESSEYLNETATPAAAAAESAMKSLAIVTERTGNSFAEAEKVLATFDDALTSKTAIAQSVRVFNSMNMSMEKQIGLIDSMRDGIVAMGGDVNTQLPLMALAIKRQEGELLDNMGVVSTVEQMYKNYAATLGTTSAKLNQAQREEAVMQGVLAETAKYTGAAAASMDTYQGKLAAVATEQRKLAEDVGNLIMPLQKLGATWDLLTTKAQRYLLARVKALPGDFVTGNIGGLGPMIDPFAEGEQLGPATPEAVQKKIKELQELSASLKEMRKGGYGPLLPGGGGKDELAFYEAKAKADTKDSEESARTARQDAERQQREAKQAAERIATDQKRVREQLTKDLALIDLEGFDRERAQTMQAHQERLRLAHENKELMKQSRVLYYAEIAKIDTAEDQKRADDLGTRIELETKKYVADRLAEEKAVSDLKKKADDELRSGITSGIKAGLDGGIPGLSSSLESASKEALTSGMVAAIEGSAANGVMGQLGAAFANPFVAAFGVVFTAGLQHVLTQGREWSEINSRYTSKGPELPQTHQDIKTVDDRISGIKAHLGDLEGQLSRAGGYSDKERIGRDIEKNKLDLGNAESLRLAIDDERKVIQMEMDATREQELAAIAMRDAASRVAAQQQQANDAFKSFQEASDEWLANQGIDRPGQRAADQAGIYAGAANRTLDGYMSDPSVAAWAKELIVGYRADGSLSQDEIMQLLGPMNGGTAIDGRGDMSIINPTDATMFQQLFTALQGIADRDQNRVLPTGTPEDPVWTRNREMEKMFSFMQKEAFYRPTGPGTRRDDSGQSGRGIKVGGKR